MTDASQSRQALLRTGEDPANGQGRRSDGRRQRQSTATAARAPKKQRERNGSSSLHARRTTNNPCSPVAAHYALRLTPARHKHAHPPHTAPPRAMDDFNSDTDSDYTSYWRDWVRPPPEPEPVSGPCKLLSKLTRASSSRRGGTSTSARSMKST